MRDFLAATRDRVVVFDGGMGATLEQFDLSLEDDYKLPGRCHEALVLNRPDVIEGVHESMVEAGAEVVETDTFQASRLKLEEWGLGEHTLEINRKRRRDRAQGRRRGPLRRRLDRPDRLPARLRGPDARPDPLPRARRGLRRAGRRACSRAASTCSSSRPRRTSSRSRPRSSARARRSRPPAARVPIQTSVSLLPNGGKMLLGTDISAALATLEALEGRRHRPQLLDRPRGHARRDPLPRRALARCRSTASRTPASRTRGPTARRSSPRSPSRWPTRSASSSSATASASSAAAAARRPTTSARSRSAAAPHADRAAPRPAPAARLLDDRRHAARAGAAPDDRRRARELAGLAQGQGAAARRRLRRPRCRSPRTRSRAARTCSTSASR